jgi:hypothetical protein
MATEPLPLRSEYLFTLSLTTGGPQAIGEGPGGDRRIFLITGGRFDGPSLSGEALPGGADWLLVQPDGTARLDVRLTLRASDGQQILLTYQGIRHGPPEVLAHVAAGEDVDPSTYYMRVLMRFETGPGPHEWLNRVVAVGIGQRLKTGPRYDVYAVL